MQVHKKSIGRPYELYKIFGEAMSKKTYTGLSVATLLGAFALRAWNLTAQSIWWDEGLEIAAASQPWGGVWSFDRFNPPLFSYMLHAWMQIAGRREWALRYLPVLIGTLIVALGMRLARKWAGESGALATGILIGGSAFAWWYSQEVRMYGLLALETLATALVLERLRTAGNRPGEFRLWATLAALEAAALYTHSVGVAVAGWAAIISASDRSARAPRRDLKPWLASQAVTAAIWLPWVIRGAAGVLRSRTIAPSPSAPWEYVRQLWAAYTLGNPMLSNHAVLTRLALIPAAALMLGIAWLLTKDRGAAIRWIAVVGLLPAMVYGLMLLRPFLFSPRYVLMCGVLALALAGALAGQMWDSGGARRIAAAALITSFIAVSAAAILLSVTDYGYQRDDERALAAHLREELGPGDVIAVPYEDEYALRYYGVGGAEILPLDMSEQPDAVIATLNGALDGQARVEVITWYQAPGDAWGLLDCWLGSHGQEIGERFTVQGLSTHGFLVEGPLPTPDFEPIRADFGIARATGMAYTDSGPDGAVCVGTRWQLTGNPDAALYMVAASTNPLGWEIAHSEGMLADRNLRPTSQWKPGDEGWAFALLRFPVGTPRGRYPLTIGLYAEGDPTGYDLIGPGGNPAGQRYEIGETVVSAECVDPRDDDLIPVGADVGNGITLEAWHTSGQDSVRPGQILRVTLRWLIEPGSMTTTQFELAAIGDRWEAVSAGEIGTPDCDGSGRYLTWHEITIPATAERSTTLSVRSGDASVSLGSLQIETEERLWEPPPFEHEAEARFPEVGSLIGFTLGAEEVSADEALPLTLIWQAEGTSDRAWTVFTHLLDDSGRLIAGHDSQPALGARPTTGWVPGEYIIDPHELRFTITDYHGPATLEIGLYDQSTGERLLTESGADHVTLAVTVQVK